jgi:segregation and condensation protein B
MSLKAKIEAVIYASDEPVTLAQLVGLLGHEAQAELDREAAAQATLALDDAVQSETGSVPGADDIVDIRDQAAQPTNGGEAAANGAPDLPEGSEVVEPTDGGEAAVDGAPGSSEANALASARAEKARAAKLRAYFRSVLDRLMAEYSAPESDRGLEIREVAGGFRIATKPEYHDAVRGFVKSLKPPLKLTLQALETLAVVAYKQPVTSPEISEIRGVDSAGVLGSLIARKLITTAGRKQVIGRPILYKTTKEFLLKFGLKDVAELPSIEEFEKMAGQMAEQEEIAMEDVSGPHMAPENEAELEEESGEHSAPADDVSEETGDKASVDGRISSLPPNYREDEDDPSADEARIQSGE